MISEPISLRSGCRAGQQARPQGCSGSAKMKPRSKGSAPPFLFDIGAERMKFCCSKLSLKNRVCTVRFAKLFSKLKLQPDRKNTFE
mmetsp:Transcript_80988/g.194272  ORF Transcript_80988/g.194272 Transcript_80988/m.194272 type:complete len:86 (-) Transcript_80988:521-778(-)